MRGTWIASPAVLHANVQGTSRDRCSQKYSDDSRNGSAVFGVALVLQLPIKADPFLPLDDPAVNATQEHMQITAIDQTCHILQHRESFAFFQLLEPSKSHARDGIRSLLCRLAAFLSSIISLLPRSGAT